MRGLAKRDVKIVKIKTEIGHNFCLKGWQYCRPMSIEQFTTEKHDIYLKNSSLKNDDLMRVYPVIFF